MVNDINTLNGSLAQLGETLASNITAKGVSASASDGLTTLANKVLQISGGGSTAIFEDACNSASGLSNYGNLVSLESSGTNANLTYDSTENAYAITSLSSGIKCYPITALNGLDGFKLSYEFRTPSTSNSYGLGLAPIIASTHTGVGLFVNKASSGRETVVHMDKNNAETYWGGGQTITGYDTSKYYKIELVIDGDDATWNLYDGDTLLRTYSYTLSSLSTDFNTLSNRDYGITVGWNNSSSVKMYIKNIKAETIGGGSTVIFNDDATTDNSSTLFSSTIPLRNNGTGRVDYVSTSPVHYAIVNTTNQAEAFLPYSLLDGVTDSFKITVKSKNNSSATCPIGLYYYIDNNNWGGVKDETTSLWVSDKTSGTFSEQSYSTGLSYSTTVITEITFDSDLNTLEINQYDENNVLQKTATMNIPVTLTSSVKWGTSITWSSNATRNVYEIKAEYLNAPSPSSDCSQYQTQIANAISYINGSGT